MMMMMVGRSNFISDVLTLFALFTEGGKLFLIFTIMTEKNSSLNHSGILSYVSLSSLLWLSR